MKYFKDEYKIDKFDYQNKITLKSDIVINLAGKAHDLKNTTEINEYYNTNTYFSNKIFDLFINSNANVFITLSSAKAVVDNFNYILSEEEMPLPVTHYGKSKLMAEQYILSSNIPIGKRFYILRPCMIHGPGNKGNLNLLYKFIKNGIPWPLGAFDNKRSYLSVENLCFVIKELIENENIESGIYNVSDDEPLSTNEVINLISNSLNIKSRIIKIPKFIIQIISKIGDLFKSPLNSDRLSKLTENFIVSNTKIKKAINKSLPISSKNGLIDTFNSFNYQQSSK